MFSLTPDQPKLVELNIQGKHFAAELWGEQGVPVIALHGWLDNCYSFRPLAPLLKNIQLLALDMAGHGHSEHRSTDASYHIWDDVREVLMIANEMGWQRFSFLWEARLQERPNFGVKIQPGGHHLHMEESVSLLAQEVNCFFA